MIDNKRLKKARTCSAKAFLVADDSASPVKLQPEAYRHAELRGAGEHLQIAA